MGLDVYLTRYEDFADTKRREERYSKDAEALWPKGVEYEDVPEADKERIRKESEAIAAALELDHYGSDEARTREINLPSSKYPKHMFKIGYFRSSYNEGGINRVLGNTLGVGLGDIFPESKDEDGYEFRPDWSAARERAVKVLGDYRAYLAKNGNYGVTVVEPNMFLGDPSKATAQNETSALAIFNKQREQVLAREPSPFGDGYSNIDGHFHIREPLKVAAMIQGASTWGFAGGRTTPAVYVIYEKGGGDREVCGDADWYEAALEIVVETCEFALGQSASEQEKLYLRWSG